MKRRLSKFLIYVVTCLSIAFLILLWAHPAIGETEYTEAWVLCQPDSYINIRAFPKKDAEKSGYLMSGDRIFVDGSSKRGFMHVYGVTEAGEGWVAKGYIVYSEPYADGHRYPVHAKGRVAARRTVNGTRRRWLHDGDILTVYMVSDEWCLTSQGFVKTEYIDLTSRQDCENVDPLGMTWEDEDAA